MGGPYVKIQIDIFNNPKIRGLSHAARDFYIQSIVYCAAYQTDGFFPIRAVVDKSRESTYAPLFERGLWHKCDASAAQVRRKCGASASALAPVTPTCTTTWTTSGQGRKWRNLQRKDGQR